MADTSELGWGVVEEYVSYPLASDKKDEKRINRAGTCVKECQAGASEKVGKGSQSA